MSCFDPTSSEHQRFTRLASLEDEDTSEEAHLSRSCNEGYLELGFFFAERSIFGVDGMTRRSGNGIVSKHVSRGGFSGKKMDGSCRTHALLEAARSLDLGYSFAAGSIDDSKSKGMDRASKVVSSLERKGSNKTLKTEVSGEEIPHVSDNLVVGASSFEETSDVTLRVTSSAHFEEGITSYDRTTEDEDEEYRKATCRARRLKSRLQKKRALVNQHTAQEGKGGRKVSNYLGVTGAVNRRGIVWQARITYSKPTRRGRSFVHLGMHVKEEDAARAFDRASIVLHGPEHAALNFKAEDYAHEMDYLCRIDLVTLAAEYRQRQIDPDRYPIAQTTTATIERQDVIVPGPVPASMAIDVRKTTAVAMGRLGSSSMEEWGTSHQAEQHQRQLAQQAAEAGMAMSYISSLPHPLLHAAMPGNGFTASQLQQLRQQIAQSRSTSCWLLGNLQLLYSQLVHLQDTWQTR